MSRFHLTPDRLTEIQGHMSTNDWAVLRDVAATRLATTTQLQTLHELRSDLGVRSFRRLLSDLHDHDVLFRLNRTVGGRKFGSAAYTYGVGMAGQRLLGLPPRRPWTPRPSWLAHALKSTDLYVSLRVAEANKKLIINRFDAEPECWRSYKGPGGEIIDIKPDAYVEVEVGDYLDRYFIETDMATESPTTLKGKVDAYAAYWSSGTEQAGHDTFPMVLWLTTDEHRADVINNVVARVPETAELHSVATFDNAMQVFIEEPP